MRKSNNQNEIRKGKCPDEKCGSVCYFSGEPETVICKKCGQNHKRDSLFEIRHNLSMEDMQAAFIHLFKRGSKDAEAVKVNGLSNYQCKLISDLMTIYGLDKESGSAKLLSSMPGNNKTFDCSKLSSRAFLIEEKHLGIQGYGIDPTAQTYLSSVLDKIRIYNNSNRYPLVPIHADGDGHCLVHAISRCLVGRELFWHPLMTNLKNELTINLMKYKMQFEDFIEEEEWNKIIAEADPCYEPIEGEPSGLRNMHIFALANVLHRPIILLDSADGLQSSADYSGLFMPVFVAPERCREKDGTKNKPLVISWSNKGRNHFVPLVGVKNEKICRLPSSLVPKVWGGFQDFVPKYIDLADDCSCVIGGNNTIKDSYIQEIVSCMEKKFKELYNVSASVVADYYHNIIKLGNKINIHYKKTTDKAKNSIEDESLHKCISCGSMIDYEIEEEQKLSLLPGGRLYQIAKDTHEILQDDTKYYYPIHNVTCRYDEGKDRLFFHFNEVCEYCSRDMRLVDADGDIKYRNGDIVQDSGNKIFWNGNLYDYLPEKFEVDLTWKDTVMQENVFWFYKEKDASRNSNAFEIAEKLVQKHYPLDFGSNMLVQRVLNEILQKTAHLKQDFATQNVKRENLQAISKPTATLSETYATTSNRIVPKSKSTQAPVKEKNQQAEAQKAENSSHQKHTPKVSCDENPSSLVKNKHDSANTKRIIRISANGKNSTINVPESISYPQLQERIQEKLGIPCKYQQIKIGFPPKLLNPPENANEPIPLNHGDKVLVEEIKSQEKTTTKPTSTKPRKASPKISEKKTQGRLHEKQQQPKENKTLRLNSLSWDMLKAMSKQETDLWKWFENKPDWFKRGGIIFSLIEDDFGTLTDGEHLSLPYFQNKVFCYEESTDEIKLCLGDRHIQVQPLCRKDLDAASRQLGKYSLASNEPKCDVLLRGKTVDFTGINSGIRPFSGHGQALGISTEDSKNKVKQNLNIESTKAAREDEEQFTTSTDQLKIVVETEKELEAIETEIPKDDSGILSDCSLFSPAGSTTESENLEETFKSSTKNLEKGSDVLPKE